MKTNDDAAKAEFGRMFGEVGNLAGEGRWSELKDCYDAVIALGESIGAPVHLIHLMFGDWLALEDPMLALHAFQEAGRTMPKDVDHEFLEQWNFGIGAQYFSLINDPRVPGGIEKALEHLEVCVEKDVNHFGMLGLLYALRQQGDLLGNWERRVSNLEAALAQVNREEDPNGWARRNREIADALTDQPSGDFAGQMELRIARLLRSLEVVGALRGPEWIWTKLSLGHCYAFRCTGDDPENQALATACFEEAAIAADGLEGEAMIDLRRQAFQGLAQRLLAEAGREVDGEAWLEKARNLISPATSPESWADLNRTEMIFLLERIRSGDKSALERVVVLHDESVALLLHLRPERILQLRLLLLDGLYAAGEDARLVLEGRLIMGEGRAGLAESTSVDGRLEAVRQLGRVAGLVADALLKNGDPEAAVDALEMGKGLVWQTNMEVATLKEIRHQIPKAGAFLFPVLGGEEGAVVIVTATQMTVALLPELGAKELKHLLFGPQPEVRIAGWVAENIVGRRDVKSLRESLGRIGGTLAEVIWKPIFQKLEQVGVESGAELVWFPEGGCDVLPLHSAWWIEDGRKHWLVERFCLRHAPSMSVLRDAGEPKDDGIVGSIAIADPEGNLDAEELEIEALETVFPGKILRGNACARESVMSVLGPTQVLHVSCHGVFVVADPWQSHFILAGGEWLTLRDCFGAMAAGAPRLVVLSACESGRMKQTTHVNEFLGFPSAFLYAGARTVLSTQWKVDDGATGLLIRHFYENLGKGMTPARSLQVARAWLREVTKSELTAYLRAIKRSGGPGAKEVGPLLSRIRTGNPDEAPFADSYFWAGVLVHGR